MRMQLAGWVLASWAIGVSGCQSWSQVGQGIPSGARVPPPGTGTYPVPSSYYNNAAGAKSGAVSSNAQPADANNVAAASTNNSASAARTAAQPLSSASAGANAGGATTVVAANWQIPTVDQVRSGVNDTASAVFEDAGTRANQVVQAGTSRAATAVEKYTDPAPSLRAPSARQALQAPSGQTPSMPAPSMPTPSSAATSRSLSDDSPAEEPQLDWQAPQ